MDVDPNQHLKDMTSQDRVECRLFHRLLKSKDGKQFMDSIKRDINWDGAGPSSTITEETHSNRKTITPAQNRDEWIGQRQIIAGILMKAQMGGRLIDTENE